MTADEPVALTPELAPPLESPRRAGRRRPFAALPRRPGLVAGQERGVSGRLLALAGLLAIAAVAALAAVVLVLVRDRPPGEHSADAGFARDMSVHHTQAVQMAITVHDRTDDPALKVLTLDIMLTQHGQIGIMEGWLDSWGLSTVGEDPAMTWMGDDAEAAMAAMPPDKTSDSTGNSMGGRMPGMATQEEINALATLPVAEMNKEFLRLMIRHHQGGVLMAQAAVARAKTPQIKSLAQSIVNTQQMEISQMEEMLTELAS